MGNKMLIDATHPEETRVVVTRGSRVEEFDYESASRKQLRGNIYLAKVARIEPSLQAAFVNYGGNRHGFLAFAEIHPDYYQIPLAVREAMMREEAEERAARPRGNGFDHEAAAPQDSTGQASTDSQDNAEIQAAQNAADRGHGGGENADNPQNHDTLSMSDITVLEESIEVSQATNLPLEAVLPPVIYDQLAEALARGEEAKDEIPSHPDDVDTASESAETASYHEQTAAEEQGAENSQPEVIAIIDDESGKTFQAQAAHSSGDNEVGGVISVPEPVVATPVEVVGSEDALEELPQRMKRRWRHYKIQEVIKRNQIVLIQVVKEERGTKGAALTTYLSLAGRYTVLMPNTASGGGISRKITVPADRKRLKEIAQELEVPEGMGLIIRTAGASRTKAEIKRDFEYLLRLWENVRDLTLKSTAPCLVYEEGDLIKRSIRDLYNKDIDEIIVAGENSYREAKEFMRMLMPSHAKNVQLYKEPEPLFTKHEVERQLNQMFSPVVTLRSGGYIVLNQTEALVAIDVNSGRATKEYSIEDTALKTNLEASEEIARQVRLRDLAGLIVIDFIDMEERRNNRAVERKIKECLRHDRARIQVGHISHFGLLEMSRQRLRQGVVEVSTMPCPTCQGVGHIRSTESVSLMILRSIEDHLRTQGAANITASASAEAALYILNHKRTYLRDIEARYGVRIVLIADEKAQGAHFSIERGSEPLPIIAPSPVEEVRAVAPMDAARVELSSEEDEEETADGVATETAEGEDKRFGGRRKRRRRGRGRGELDFEPGYRNGPAHGNATALEAGPVPPAIHGLSEGEAAVSVDTTADAARVVAPEDGPEIGSFKDDGDGSPRHRRRGRRGGRRYRSGEEVASAETAQLLQNGGVPGLGEQPIVPSNFAPPVEADAFRPVQSSIVAPEPVVRQMIAEALPVETANELEASHPQNGHANMEVRHEEVKHEEPTAAPPSAVEIIAAQEPEAQHANGTVALNGAAPTAEPVVQQKPEPAPMPVPKPVRAGPPKKGWWQRSVR